MNNADLANRFSDEIECFVFDSLPSTNDYLKQLNPSPKVQICVSAQQTSGRGQYGRTWQSQKNRSILLSVRYPFDLNVALNTALNGLSLMVGLAVINALESYNIHGLKLKWPNDVYFNDQKLAGILIEKTVINNKQSVVIGLGLNYQLDADFECGTKWIDLSQIAATVPDLTDLQESLIKNLLKYCHIFARDGLGAFQPQWREYDYLLNKTVELGDKNQKSIGIAKGINKHGALIVHTNTSVIEVYSSAQIYVI